MTAAVSRAKQLGARVLAAPRPAMREVPSQLRAAAGLPAVIVMPRHPGSQRNGVPGVWRPGRQLNGLISECGKYVAEHKDREGLVRRSTLKEPYRVEGKKTHGLRALGAVRRKTFPTLFLSTGGGVGLIGMCKASTRCRRWAGLARPARAWWSCRPKDARPSCGHGKPTRIPPLLSECCTIASGLRVSRAARRCSDS